MRLEFLSLRGLSTRGENLTDYEGQGETELIKVSGLDGARTRDAPHDRDPQAN